jgi:hypothetical protein
MSPSRYFEAVPAPRVQQWWADLTLQDMRQRIERKQLRKCPGSDMPGRRRLVRGGTGDDVSVICSECGMRAPERAADQPHRLGCPAEHWVHEPNAAADADDADPHDVADADAY